MNFLLDTNLISETFRPAPNPGAMAWLDGVAQETTFVSVISIAELRRGISRMPAGLQRRRVEIVLEQKIPDRYYGRTLIVDEAIAEAWGELMAQRDAAGRPFSPMDAFLAATCAIHDLTLVTRNAADFQGSVEQIVNPWT